MRMYVNINGENRELEQIPQDMFSEFTFKRYLNTGNEIRLLMKKYKAGGREALLQNITLEKVSNVREVNGTFLAELLFDYHEYQFLEPFGKVRTINGLKMIETTVTFTKDDIIGAGVIPLGGI